MVSRYEQKSFIQVRGMVARALLEHSGDGAGKRLAQRDIAAELGADWGTVHHSLKSMQEQGAIRIEHNRLFINKDRLLQLAGATV
ncbi:MAG: hypothetical protein A2Y92_01040 [Chloroflexi bacterium RBG_13_57_8]|nr:MAG: hypothetical protein A2Y92_01040 [Chloroflexi bacterium RBG_13_57_8]